jgi:hypothetical protein
MSASGVERLEVHAAHADIRVGNYGPVHLVAYHGTPTVTTLRTSERYHRLLRGRFPRGTAILSWVAGGLKMPDKDVRDVGSELFKAVAPQIWCSATVIPGEGFWASAARSVLTGIQILSRSPCPDRAFGKIDEAVAWMMPYLTGAPDVEARALTEVMGALVHGESGSKDER